MSHIEQQRNLFAKNRTFIEKALKWDDMTYNTFQFEAGIIYLEETLKLIAFDVKMISHEELFWKWWINEWNLLDAVQVPIFQNMQRPLLLKDYVRVHSMAMVDKFPTNAILDESYAKMIGEFNDKHNNSHATNS